MNVGTLVSCIVVFFMSCLPNKNGGITFPQLLHSSGLAQKKNKARLFCNIDAEFPEVALTNLGKRGVGLNELEEVDEGRENVRTGVAGG